MERNVLSWLITKYNGVLSPGNRRGAGRESLDRTETLHYLLAVLQQPPRRRAEMHSPSTAYSFPWMVMIILLVIMAFHALTLAPPPTGAGAAGFSPAGGDVSVWSSDHDAPGPDLPNHSLSSYTPVCLDRVGLPAYNPHCTAVIPLEPLLLFPEVYLDYLLPPHI
jgi:hypothetical protein